MDMGCWSACRGDFRWRRYQGPGVALPCMLNITTNLQQTTKCLTREYTIKPEHVNAITRLGRIFFLKSLWTSKHTLKNEYCICTFWDVFVSWHPYQWQKELWVCLSPLQYETSIYEKREDYSAIVLSMVVDYSIHFSKVSQTMRQNQASLCLWGECRQAIVLCGVQKWHVVLIFTP